MSYRVFAPLILLLALAFVSVPAAAHGAPAAREFDIRVIADWTGVGGEGEYHSAVREMGPGHDILALDAREAYTGSGSPALFLRLVMQGGHFDHGALRDVLFFMVDGTERQFFVETVDNQAFTHNFDFMTGPIP